MRQFRRGSSSRPQAQRDASLLVTGAGDESMAPVGDADLMRIMYTSGTTDHPKGVMHSYRNFYAKSADQIVELGLSGDTRLLMAGPLYHVGAFDLPGIAVLWTGGMLCIQRDFDAGGALDLIEAERLTAAWTAPVMAGALLAAQQQAPRDVSSLEWVIGGGERTPEARIRGFATGLRQRPLHRRLWPDRNLRRRYADGARARDRQDRLGRASAASKSISKSATRPAAPCRPARKAKSACAGPK